MSVIIYPFKTILQWMRVPLYYVAAVSQGAEPSSHLPSCLSPGPLHSPCQPPSMWGWLQSYSFLEFYLEGKVGYRKVACCLSTQGVSSSETCKLAAVDRHQGRANLRHITSWHDNWRVLQNRMGHFPVPPFKKYLPQCLRGKQRWPNKSFSRNGTDMM